MDQSKLIQSYKDQGYSIQRTLFTLKLHERELSSETLTLIRQIYNVSVEQLDQIKTGRSTQSSNLKGLHTMLICQSCQKNEQAFVAQLSQVIDTPIGSTSSDGWISFDWVGCMGLCGLGPNAILDQKIYHTITNNAFFMARLHQILDERKPR